MEALHLGLYICGNIENSREKQAPIPIGRWRSKICELMLVSQVQHQCGYFIECVTIRCNQHWHQAGRVYGEEIRGAMLASLNVYFSEFVLYFAFLEHPLDQRCTSEVTPIENVHGDLPVVGLR